MGAGANAGPRPGSSSVRRVLRAWAEEGGGCHSQGLEALMRVTCYEARARGLGCWAFGRGFGDVRVGARAREGDGTCRKSAVEGIELFGELWRTAFFYGDNYTRDFESASSQYHESLFFFTLFLLLSANKSMILGHWFVFSLIFL